MILFACIKLKIIFLKYFSGNESDANEILDKLTSSKGQTPNLSKYEIHAVTSCVKKFLRSLKEPVIPLR